MMTNYNLSLLQNSTNLVEVAQTANTYTDGLLSMAIVLAIFFIMIGSNYDKMKPVSNLAVASFVSFVLSGFLTLAGLVSVLFTAMFLVVLAFSVLRLYTSKDTL